MNNLFEFLFQPGEAIEVRVVQPWCGSGFFDNAGDLQAALGELDEARPDGIYCTLNPVTREAFDRAPNAFRRAVRGQKLASSGKDIAARKWILLDCDAIRPRNVSATDEEKSLAVAKAKLIRDFLLSEGAPEMVEADSGNGAHLLLPCDLPNDSESTRLVRGFLEFLSRRFTDERVKLDSVNFNPDRITKAYGTFARKGSDTPERPHRRSGIVSLPSVALPVSRELLERMQLQPGQRSINASFGEQSLAQLNHWAATIPNFPATKQIKREPDKITVIPEYCYLNPEHQGTSPGIVFHSDGGRGNACKHEGCNLPFKAWWAKVEALFGQTLSFEPTVILGQAKTDVCWTLQNYAGIKVERVSWIFKNYLPCGRPTALVGEPGEGKSLTTVDWAARITTGRGFPVGTEALIPPSSVLMLNSEDSAADTIKPRFLMAGGDASRLYQLNLPMGTSFNVDDDGDIRRLAEQLTAHPDIVCLMIDPILQHVTSEKEQDVRRGVAQLRALVQERGIAFLYAAHFNKVAGKNLSSPLDKLSGAKAWSGLPRVVLAAMTGKHDETLGRHRHHLVLGKSNLGALDIPTQDFVIEGRAREGLTLGTDTIPIIHWLGESKVSMRELLENRQPKKADDGSLEETASLLQAELLDQPRPASDVIQALTKNGVKLRTLERAKALLMLNKIMAKPENLGGSWYWRLATSGESTPPTTSTL